MHTKLLEKIRIRIPTNRPEVVARMAQIIWYDCTDDEKTSSRFSLTISDTISLVRPSELRQTAEHCADFFYASPIGPTFHWPIHLSLYHGPEEKDSPIARFRITMEMEPIFYADSLTIAELIDADENSQV